MAKQLTPAYKRYLKSPQWKAKRELWFAKYGKWCRGCGRRDGPITLHHMTYDRLYHEALTDLTAFCFKCHNECESFHYKIGRRTDGKVAAMKFIAMKRAKRKSL